LTRPVARKTRGTVASGATVSDCGVTGAAAVGFLVGVGFPVGLVAFTGGVDGVVVDDGAVSVVALVRVVVGLVVALVRVAVVALVRAAGVAEAVFASATVVVAGAGFVADAPVFLGRVDPAELLSQSAWPSISLSFCSQSALPPAPRFFLLWACFPPARRGSCSYAGLCVWSVAALPQGCAIGL